MTRPEIVAEIHTAIDAGNTARANRARAQLRALDHGKVIACATRAPAGAYRPSCSYGIEQPGFAADLQKRVRDALEYAERACQSCKECDHSCHAWTFKRILRGQSLEE